MVEEYKSNRYPVDHMFRGMIAGAGELIYGEPTEAIETKCRAVDYKLPYCEFVVKPTKNLDKKNPLIKRQLKPTSI